VVRAQQDLAFALNLLQEGTRADALNDPSLELTDEQRAELSPILDEIASMSFQEAIQRLRAQKNTALT
jgi:hypothetical protein